MYDIRQFRPTFYLVLILALGGYGIALESWPHLIGGVFLVGLYAMLALRGSTFRVPRLLASALAILCGAWSLLALFRGAISPVVAISQWLFMLVLIILYSRRDNRAYGQLLVMSLVLMVAGSVNSASFVFGAILICYLFLSLYCCLLFHLKVESEHATRAYNLSDNKALPGSLRHDQTHFNRSMRRLAILVSAVAIASGVVVFLLFPRSRVSTAFAMAAQSRQQAPLTGFSDRMGFDQIASITQNEEVVANISLSENGNPLPPSDIYLRGMTFDIYTGRSMGARRDWQWIRSDELRDTRAQYHLTPGEWHSLAPTPGARQIHQTILLQPTGTSTLFALNGIAAINSDSGLNVQHFPIDGSLRADELPRAALRYEAISTGQPPSFQAPGSSSRLSSRGLSDRERPSDFRSPASSRIAPEIANYAAQPEVSGADASGPYATQRDKSIAAPTPLDEQIATAICRHLQSQFKYTLDLSGIPRKPNEDPIVQFLKSSKRGHCEYFAGAMTLLCQSLGLNARVVIGFHAGSADYNDVGDYYTIRQSHAHAWVEVLTPEGWKSFDPTTGNASYTPRTSPSIFSPLTNLFDYLQYRWASSVVIYDNENFSLIDAVELRFITVLDRSKRMLDSTQRYMQSQQGLDASLRILDIVIIALVASLLLTIVIFLISRRRLNRRAQRIGLGALPSPERLRLAKQLRFYDDLLKLLARRRIGRPPHLTPREFAATLGFLPSAVYETIGRLTEVFYRVRYGEKPLDALELRQVDASIAEIAANLAGRDLRI